MTSFLNSLKQPIVKGIGTIGLIGLLSNPVIASHLEKKVKLDINPEKKVELNESKESVQDIENIEEKDELNKNENERVYREIPSVNPPNLAYGGIIFSEEYPVPVLLLSYDSDNDGWEDMRFFYSIENIEGYIVYPKGLIKFHEDINRNKKFDANEKFSIIKIDEEIYEKSKIQK